jgi:hypothetical protein
MRKLKQATGGNRRIREGTRGCLVRPQGRDRPLRIGQLCWNAGHRSGLAERDGLARSNNLKTPSPLGNRLRIRNADPRPAHAHQYFSLFNADPTPDGIKNILTIGAAQ